MENSRAEKIARLVQKELGELLLSEFRELTAGAVVTVTEVRLSPDLGYARIYFSVFPFVKSGEIMRRLEEKNWLIRKTLGTRMRNQLRIVPELTFVLDESAEYIQKIDDLLK